MKWVTGCFIFFFMGLSSEGFSQKPDTLIKKLDSLSKKDDSVKQDNNINPGAYNERTKITAPVYFILLGSNLKQQITGPFNTSKKSWKQVGGFALITGALAFADVPIQKRAVNFGNKSITAKNVSRFITNFGGLYEGYTLASLMAYGFIFKNEKLRTTTLLATQSYITGAAVMEAVKYLTGRQRPNYYGTDSIAARATFHGPFSKAGREYNGKAISSSFPSGHTTVAFAAATVFAMEYKDRLWVPILAYSAASLIGISRITENKHWATDVLVGAGLGYLSGRQVVNNYHRYARLSTSRQKGSGISFHLQYNFGQLMPGFVYRF
jgi:membrane-associated phospholipid phosphatase